VSVGNDVVDLADPETRLFGLHPRFEGRVFGAAERAALEASPEAQRLRLHWALWAAKESAYKLLKRREAATVFSPREFAVEFSVLPAPGTAGRAIGRVTHRGERFDLEVHLDEASVHAVARSESEARSPVLWQVAAVRDDAGGAVRRLAAAAIGSALALDAAELRIVGRPPMALHRGRPLEAGLSLSHHGRFVAFACILPRGARCQ
jgi:hypothetical protein